MSQISIGPLTLRAPSLGVGAEPSRRGHPYRVVWRISAHSIGTKASSIHLSLVASRWNHPTGRVWFFSHSIAMKSSLVIWSIFLQDGVTPFGSGSNDLISSKGIPTVGLLVAFFRPVLGVSFCHPSVGSEAERVPHSVVFASGGDSVYVRLADEGVGPGPSSSGPVASRSPLADRSASAASSTSGDGCCPGWFRWVALFWDRLPSPVCYMEWVSCAGPFVIQALYGEVCGFSALAPSLAGVLPFLHQELSLDVVISFHPVLRALLRSLRVSSPSRAVHPPSWALAVFLRHLPSSSFASLRSTPLHSLVKMVLFFVALATAIPIGELQALSRCFSLVRGDACLSFVLPFLPSVSHSLLHPSLLLGFIAVRLCGWSRHMSFALPSSCPPHFPGQDGFRAVSPLPSFCLSALPVSGSFCGHSFVPPPGGIHEAGAARLEVSPVRTHEFSGISTSVAFLSDGGLLCLFSLCFLCFMRVPA